MSTTQSAQMVKDIWLAMSTIYGHRWISGYGAQPNTLAVQLWGEGLEGLDETQIKTGIQACFKLTDEWPPSLPQFRKLCLDIPPLMQVKQDMRQSHRPPFTQFVMGFLDHWNYRQADQYHAEKLLRQAYDLAVHHRMNGALLPEPPAALLENKVPAPKPMITAEDDFCRMIAHARKQHANDQAREKTMKDIKALFG